MIFAFSILNTPPLFQSGTGHALHKVLLTEDVQQQHGQQGNDCAGKGSAILHRKLTHKQCQAIGKGSHVRRTRGEHRPEQVIPGAVEAQYKQAYNTWQNSVLSAGNEVSNALVLYNTSAKKSKLEEKQIAALKKNVEDTRELMASAGSNYLQVITAESSLLNAQLSKISDDFSKMQAIVNLYYALGGGAK